MLLRIFSIFSWYYFLSSSDVTAQQLFLPPTCYEVGIAPRYLISADFNNDGKPDIASSDWFGGTASVILGNGDGTFNMPHTYPVGTAPQNICTADFNGDGQLDLATSNVLSNNISILYGLGNGQFTVALPLVLDEPVWVISGDFNLDGNADMAVALNSFGKIAVLTGDGIGGFTIQKYSSGGQYPSRIACADFNIDGKMDLAVSNYGDGMALLKGDGLGGFVTTDSFINVPVNIPSLFTVDVNNDGRKDLAFCQNSIIGYKYIDMNVKFDTSSPNFGIAIVAQTNTNGMCAADFNEDGIVDFAVSQEATDSTTIVVGLPAFPDSFAVEARNYFAVCAHMPYSMLTADFNNDTHADLAVSNEGGSNVSIFMNKLTAPNSVLEDQLELVAGGVVIYPNPANTILHIKTERPERRELYNSLGVLQYETEGNEIDISRLSKGIYYLKCWNSVRKVIVE